MACKYKYNDKWFTEDELIYLIGEKKNLLDISNKQALERLNSLQEIFKQSPELQSIGTIFDYDSYLDTIFPDSKVKDIVYHGTYEEFDTFRNKLRKALVNDDVVVDKEDIWFTSNQIAADTWGPVKSVILNIQSPFIINEKGNYISTKNRFFQKKDYLNNDSIIVEDVQNFLKQYDSGNPANYNEKARDVSTNYIVFEPEQIHILGSKKDIEGFREFVNNKSFNQINQINYSLKAVEILSSDKTKQVFEKGKKNGWDLDKILTELQIPKEQKQIILDYKDNYVNNIFKNLEKECS